MRNRHNEKVHTVEEALIAAHRRRISDKPDDAFARNVMFEVRQVRAKSLEQPRNGTESRVVWGFAVASSLMAIAIFAYSLNIDVSGIQFAQSVVGDPSTVMMAEAFADI